MFGDLQCHSVNKAVGNTAYVVTALYEREITNSKIGDSVCFDEIWGSDGDYYHVVEI